MFGSSSAPRVRIPPSVACGITLSRGDPQRKASLGVLISSLGVVSIGVQPLNDESNSTSTPPIDFPSVPMLFFLLSPRLCSKREGKWPLPSAKCEMRAGVFAVWLLSFD